VEVAVAFQGGSTFGAGNNCLKVFEHESSKDPPPGPDDHPDDYPDDSKTNDAIRFELMPAMGIYQP
jgi:hypothetical protein